MGIYFYSGQCRSRKNGSQQIELDDNEEEEMDSRHEEYEGD